MLKYIILYKKKIKITFKGRWGKLYLYYTTHSLKQLGTITYSFFKKQTHTNKGEGNEVLSSKTKTHYKLHSKATVTF